MRWFCIKSESCSVVSNSLRPHGLQSLWNSPGQNTGVGSLSLLQGIFATQGLNPGLPHHGQILYQLSHKGSPDYIGTLYNSGNFSINLKLLKILNFLSCKNRISKVYFNLKKKSAWHYPFIKATLLIIIYWLSTIPGSSEKNDNFWNCFRYWVI